MSSQSRILFSEAHGERLKANDPHAVLPCTQWAKELENLGFQVASSKAALTQEGLEQCDVLVLGSPTGQLSESEIDAVANFVCEGGGLLLINDAEAVRSQTQNLNELERASPCQFREYLNAFPATIEEFHPHYVTAGLASLSVSGNCRLVPLLEGSRPLATIQETGENFALCSEVENGRVITVADSALFSDDCLGIISNLLFAAQCCLWLARRNPVDVYDVNLNSPSIDRRVAGGHRWPPAPSELSVRLSTHSAQAAANALW